MLADDIKIVYTFETNLLHEWVSKIQFDLSSITTWCANWLMNFSTSKCQVMSYKCNIPQNCFLLQDSHIPIRPSVLDLGITYSCSFNFSEHIAVQVAKAKKVSYLILRSFQLPQCRLALFKTHVRPIIEYCSFVYTNLRKCDRIQLEKVQRRFTKAIDSHFSYRQRCLNMQVSPIWLRRTILNLVFLFRLKHKLTYSSNDPINFVNNSPYGLRNKEFLLPIPRCRTTLRSNFFLLTYSKLFNTLPSCIRGCSTLAHFRNSISSYITPERLYTIFKPPLSIDIFYEDRLDGL